MTTLFPMIQLSPIVLFSSTTVKDAIEEFFPILFKLDTLEEVEIPAIYFFF